MALGPFLTTSVSINDPNVLISRAPDGSMVLQDNYSSAKLKDIINGNTTSTVLVEVEPSDWSRDPNTLLYTVIVPHDFAISGSELAQFLTVIMDTDFHQITVNSVQVQANNVYITSTVALNIYVAMKRI